MVTQHLREKAGIEDRAKVFHSFRHSFKGMARDARLGKEVHDALTGHSGGAERWARLREWLREWLRAQGAGGGNSQDRGAKCCAGSEMGVDSLLRWWILESVR